jgi:hypothetical protein
MTNQDETPQENRNKRVRINEESNTSFEPNDKATPQVNMPPSAASRAALKEAVASHPDAIKEVAEALLKDYISLKNKERQEANTMSHFDDTAWMPRSARMKFSLTTSESIMETEDFKKLSTEATAAIASFQQKAKSLIKSVLKLAIKDNQSKFNTLMEQALHRFGTMVLLADKAYTDDPPTEKFVWYCLSKDEIPARVFDYTGTKRHLLADDFRKKANERLAQELADKSPQVTTMTEAMIDVDEDEDDPRTQTQQAEIATQPQAEISPDEVTHYRTLLKKFTDLITALFCTCWEQQLAAQARIDSDRRLKKQAQEFLKGDKTKDTAIELEKEAKIEPKRIADLIKQEVVKATGKINKKVDRISQQHIRSAKNDQRGAPQKRQQQQQQKKQPSSPASASSKKKKAEKKDEQKKSNQKGTKGRQNSAKKSDNKPRGRGSSVDSKGKGSPKGKPAKKNTGGPNKQRGRSRSNSRERQHASRP